LDSAANLLENRLPQFPLHHRRVATRHATLQNLTVHKLCSFLLSLMREWRVQVLHSERNGPGPDSDTHLNSGRLERGKNQWHILK